MNIINIGIIGQSLAGPSGNTPYAPAAAGQIFWNIERIGLADEFYPAADPMAGWYGSGGGTIWSRLGYLMAHQPTPLYDQVCYAIAAAPGTGSYYWRGDQPGMQRIRLTRQRLALQGMRVSCWFWMNGELDASLDHPGGYHRDNVLNMVGQMRADGDLAPVFVAKETTYQQYNGVPCGPMFQGLGPELRLARSAWQTRVQDEQHELRHNYANLGIYPGANMDLIDSTGRYDGGHLNAAGSDFAALLWFGVIAEAKANGLMLPGLI